MSRARRLAARGQVGEAADVLAEASQEALRRRRLSEARTLAAEGLRLCADDDVDRARALLTQFGQSARLDRAVPSALEVLAELRQRFEDGPVEAHCWLATARLRSYVDDYDGRREALLAAEHAAGRWDDARGLLEVLTESAFPVGRGGPIAQTVRHGRQGLQLAEQLGDDSGWARCAANLGTALVSTGDVGATDLLEAARGRLDRTVLRERVEYLRQTANLAMAHFWLGGYERARNLVAEARRMTDEPFWDVSLDFLDGLLDWRGGAWDAALARLDGAAADDGVGFFPVAAVISDHIRMERGDLRETRAMEAATQLLVDRQEDLYVGLALALVGQVRAWRREPNPLRGITAHAQHVRAAGLARGWHDLLPVAAAVDPSADDRLRRLVHQTGAPGPHAGACLRMADGMAVVRDGRPHQVADAVDALREAAQAFAALAEPYDEARAWDGVARLELARAAGPAARAAAGEAAERYRDIGADRSLARLLRTFRRRGLLSHWRIPESQAGRRAAGLTAREHEVAELAGRGMTTAEIADQLVVSAATVRTHLERVKRKLGLRHKRDLIQWAQE